MQPTLNQIENDTKYHICSVFGEGIVKNTERNTQKISISFHEIT